VGNLCVVFQFSAGRRSCGSVISTALPALRAHSDAAVGDSSFTARNTSALIWRIFRAASVSLIRRACRSRCSQPIPGLRNFSASGSDFNFS